MVLEGGFNIQLEVFSERKLRLKNFPDGAKGKLILKFKIPLSLIDKKIRQRI